VTGPSSGPRWEHSRDPSQEDLVRAIRAAGVDDPRVIQAFRNVERAAFVPADLVPQAYVDRPLPIPHDQVTTQPSLVAKMLEALGLAGAEHALEVGTGYGFQTALLARLCRFVWSIEHWPDLAETARAHLRAAGVPNVKVVVGDGTAGFPEHAPYEAIIVAAAFPTVPPPLAEQLAPGGRLVQPIGTGGDDEVTIFEKSATGLIRRGTVTLAHFVKLRGRHAYPG
jgi:protein-L-isoaspartate(D-aspartate) O-methyltransferase